MRKDVLTLSAIVLLVLNLVALAWLAHRIGEVEDEVYEKADAWQVDENGAPIAEIEGRLQ